MRPLILARDETSDQGTFGEIFHPRYGVLCKTAELPWRENARGKSCIPAGVYTVAFMERSGSGKYKDVWHVQDVPGRSGILIHAGNFCGDEDLGYRSDVDGCILLGTEVGVLENQKVVLSSKLALMEFNEDLGTEPFELIIWDRT